MKKLIFALAAVIALPAIAREVKPMLVPAPGSENVNVDTRLSIIFESEPEIGNSGMIRIYDAETDVCVDSLDMAVPAGPTTPTKLPKAPYTLEPYIYDSPRQTNRTVR
ncbi:MAG: carbohydrate esterase, partial [Duncaniella sp.]|nr:carbohydrate esterase [Duncaniella sp.]